MEKAKELGTRSRMIFELSKTRIGLQSTIKEVNDEYEIIPPQKNAESVKC